MELEVKFSSRLGRNFKLKTVWQCHVGELILENLAKDQCCAFALYGRLMYPHEHGQGSLASTLLG